MNNRNENKRQQDRIEVTTSNEQDVLPGKHTFLLCCKLELLTPMEVVSQRSFNLLTAASAVLPQSNVAHLLNCEFNESAAILPFKNRYALCIHKMHIYQKILSLLHLVRHPQTRANFSQTSFFEAAQNEAHAHPVTCCFDIHLNPVGCSHVLKTRILQLHWQNWVRIKLCILDHHNSIWETLKHCELEIPCLYMTEAGVTE